MTQFYKIVLLVTYTSKLRQNKFIVLDAMNCATKQFAAVNKFLGPYSQHLIFFGTYEFAQKARVFLSGDAFHSSVT